MEVATRHLKWLVVAWLTLLTVMLHPHPAVAEQVATAQLPTSVTRPPPGAGKIHAATSLDLARHGYIEEEFFVGGKANVYQYGPGGAVTIKTPAMDYTTRILVRRPLDPRRFSGTVRVETMHPQYAMDFIWPRTADFAIANGDAEVSISTRRGQNTSGIDALKRFDPVRYAAIEFAEDGLNWDVIGQVGRLLKTSSPANPLNGYRVRRLTAQGWSGGGALLLIYISDGFHDRARMPDGRPIFDGYLVGEPSGYPRINSAGAGIANDDPRQKVRAIDVPVIALHTRPQELYRRRPDGNRARDRYRVYEVAGAAHNNNRLPAMFGQPAQGIGRAGCVFDVSWFPLPHYFKSTLARLDDWGARNTAPPPSRRLAVSANGSPVLDRHGNRTGGVRSSYLDVPTARYVGNAPNPTNGGPSCAQDGGQVPFDAEKLVALYGNQARYVRLVDRRLSELVRQRWLLPADAQELRREARQFNGFGDHAN